MNNIPQVYNLDKGIMDFLEIIESESNSNSSLIVGHLKFDITIIFGEKIKIHLHKLDIVKIVASVFSICEIVLSGDHIFTKIEIENYTINIVRQTAIIIKPDLEIFLDKIR